MDRKWPPQIDRTNNRWSLAQGKRGNKCTGSPLVPFRSILYTGQSQWSKQFRKFFMPMEFPKKIEVVAYSGYKANERPLYFVLDEEKLEVKNTIDKWYGVEHDYFKVLADDGRVYLLKWHRTLDLWFVERVLERLGKQ